MHSEHTKHVADRLAQSKVAPEVLNCALLVQKVLLSHNGHLKSCPFIETVSGSDFLNRLIISDFG